MAEVYELLMKLGVKNEASAALLHIGGQLHHMHEIVNRIGSGIGGWNTALAAVAGALATGAIVAGFERIMKAGAEVNHQIELMKSSGMTGGEIDFSRGIAMGTAGRVLGTTMSENLKHINELRAAFGGTTEAVKHLDELSKANVILNSILAKHGVKGHDEVWELVKSLEGKNLTFDDAAFSSYLNTMMRVVEATGGRVTPQSFFQTFKYGRSATMGWDESFIGGALGRLIQEFTTGGAGGGAGRGGPGAALSQDFAAVIQGQMKKSAAAEFEKLKLGSFEDIPGGDEGILHSMKGRDLFIRNPYEWVQQVLMPSMAANGITKQNDVMEEINKLFQNKVAAFAIQQMATGGRFMLGANSPFEKDIRLNQGAPGLPVYEELVKNDYPTIMNNFSKSFEHLLEVLGQEMMKPDGPVIRTLSSLTVGLQALATFISEHPTAVKIIETALIGVAGAFIAIGAAGVVAVAAMLGTGGLIYAGIIGLAGALIALGVVYWDNIASGFSAFTNAVKTFSTIAWDSLVSGFTSFMNAIQSMANWVITTYHSIEHFLDLSRFLIPRAQNQSFEGDRTGLLHQMAFNPGISTKQVLQPVQITIDLDGHLLGQKMMDILQDMTTFPTQAPSPNGQVAWRSPDGGWMNT